MGSRYAYLVLISQSQVRTNGLWTVRTDVRRPRRPAGRDARGGRSRIKSAPRGQTATKSQNDSLRDGCFFWLFFARWSGTSPWPGD